ncbi:O-antigen ligase family protein [Aeromicrobium endophyticum]|uniref:O-antigen ligase domain-containing protein n=1 Tax=Aeromicrobium endophyticum TaxID=2292704 RepID=A0A371P5M7_9ACTN|nr:O-antigen ligase family protein [Aeromicrobium endophyticum]REK70858.1 O-antigen ligase domain-containing protein [Aeromicrobium endophyticum]
MADPAAVRAASVLRDRVVVDDRVGTGATIVAVVCGWLLATRQSIVVPFTLGLTPVAIAWYAGGLLLLLCWLGRQQVRRPHRPTVLLVMGMLAATLVSSAALMVRGPAGDQASQSLQLVGREIGLLAAALLVMVVIGSVADLARVVQGIVVGAAVSALLALVQVATGVDLAGSLVLPGLIDQGTAAAGELLRAGAVRPAGSAGHPLELSAVLTAAFPLAVGLTLSRRARGEAAGVWVAASAVIGLGAVSTISRSAFVGIAAALVVMAWRWPVRRVVVGGGVVVVAVLGAVAAGVPLVSRLADVLVEGTGDNSVGSRSSGLSYALQRLPQHWLVGQGSGTYDVSKQPVLDNFYLTRLVESGIVGLLALVLMVGGAWTIALRASRRAVVSPGAGDFELVNGILGSITAVAVVAVILDLGGFAQISTLLYVLVALAGAAALVTLPTPPTRSDP